MFKVIKHFTDLQDEGYAYSVGDEFPRKGKKVSKARLEELSSDKNKRHTPLIEEVAEETAEKPAEEPAKPKRTKKKG